MRGLRLYSAILVTVLFVFFAGIYWPLAEKSTSNKNTALKENEIRDFQVAESDFNKGRYDEALAIVLDYQDSISEKSDFSYNWLNLLVKISEKMVDIPQLVLIDEYYPEVLTQHEKASLLVAENYLMNGKDKEYLALRNRFTQKKPWTILDVDYLLLQGNYLESYQILESSQLEGKEEVLRLIRLALLNATDDKDKALSYLNEANRLDPSDIDVILYTIKILENQGKTHAALEVYKKGIVDNPKYLLLRDQLGLFYINEGNYEKALDTWKSALIVAGDDLMQAEILAKLIFFNKVIHSEKTDINRYLPINSPLMPLISYLSNLSQDQYVDLNTLSLLPLKNKYLKQEQILYWLPLLDALNRQDEGAALKMLHENPFKDVSYNRELEFALLQALNFRQLGTLLPTEFKFDTPGHPLIDSLTKRDHPLTEDMEALLKSPEVFSAILMQFDWTETALQLHKMNIIPEHFPNFVVLDLIHAMRKTLGDEAALKFAVHQTQTVDVAFLVQELNARQALKNGNLEIAEKIYQSIADKSFEAKSYLARKAFKDNELEKATLLTEELLKKYPDHPLLLDNLKKIEDKRS